MHCPLPMNRRLATALSLIATCAGSLLLQPPAAMAQSRPPTNRPPNLKPTPPKPSQPIAAQQAGNLSFYTRPQTSSALFTGRLTPLRAIPPRVSTDLR